MKKIIKFGFLGMLIGIVTGYMISLIISILMGDGIFYVTTPEFASLFSSELNAVIIQTILYAILGAGFSLASFIWMIDSWSLLKQSAIYFLIISIIMLPIAYISGWMEHSLQGFLVYFGGFALIFITIWLVQYFNYKHKIKQINAAIKNK